MVDHPMHFLNSIMQTLETKLMIPNCVHLSKTRIKIWKRVANRLMSRNKSAQRGETPFA